MIFSIAIQIIMPYLMVYIEQGLEITGGQFTLTFGVVLVVSCIITVLLGAFMDKIGKNKLIFPALGANILGTFLLFFVRSSVGVMICGTIMMTGFMVTTAILGAKLRDYTPPKETGLFQGVRMIFIVMIPMITGPYIGLGVSNINATKYVNEFGIEVLKPNAYIFLFGAIVLALTIIPVIFLLRKEKKLSNEAK
jgi:MFS family permease